VGEVALTSAAQVLEGFFELTVVGSGESALGVAGEKGPFAAVLTADEPLLEEPEGPGGVVGLFEEFERKWPDTSRILLTDRSSPGSAIEFLRTGSIFRLLSKPFAGDDLHDCVRAGVSRFHTLAQERLLTEQLQFSRESLLGLTETLERRLAAQIGRLHGMQRYASELKELRTLDEVARLTADTAFRLLGERSTEVEFEARNGREATRALRGDPLTTAADFLPISTAEGILGHIRIEGHSRGQRGLSPSDHEILASLTASAAISARSQVHIHDRNRAQHATIFALAHLAEYRDDETGRHLDRVTAYCRLAAEGLRDDGGHPLIITDAFIRDLELSAPLHDIGKVGIPDSILHKPGKLTEEEWVVMRKHSTIGAETLRRVLETSGEQSFLRMGYEIALYHHERWGGGGYPEGLSGEEIPLAARIMAIADCYDALTTRRPYKEPWTHSEAMSYIVEQRGLHFDPEVVDAFDARSQQADDIRAFLADEPLDDLRSIPNVA
jgi:response regulator RpfG family c-di-GMP phosphodiesterase